MNEQRHYGLVTTPSDDVRARTREDFARQTEKNRQNSARRREEKRILQNVTTVQLVRWY